MFLLINIKYITLGKYDDLVSQSASYFSRGQGALQDEVR